jgi:two-component system sensor histidine kinase/response regulator
MAAPGCAVGAPATHGMDNAMNTFSSEELLAMVGTDHEMLCQLRDIFEEEAPRVLHEIRAAVTDRNAAALEHHTHLMKNVVASVGGQASRDIAITMERAARAQDLHETPALADRLAHEIDALRVALDSFITARAHS